MFEPTVGEIVRLVEAQKRDIEKNGQKLDVSISGQVHECHQLTLLVANCTGRRLRRLKLSLLAPEVLV